MNACKHTLISVQFQWNLFSNYQMYTTFTKNKRPQITEIDDNKRKFSLNRSRGSFQFTNY